MSGAGLDAEAGRVVGEPAWWAVLDADLGVAEETGRERAHEDALVGGVVCEVGCGAEGFTVTGNVVDEVWGGAAEHALLGGEVGVERRRAVLNAGARVVVSVH